MEYMRALLRDNELFRTFVTVSLSAPLPLSVSPFLVLTLLCSHVHLSVHTVGGDTQAVQPAQAGRHGGQAPPATHQVPPAAQKHSQEDGRAVGARRPQRHGEDGPSELSLSLPCLLRCILSAHVLHRITQECKKKNTVACEKIKAI